MARKPAQPSIVPAEGKKIVFDADKDRGSGSESGSESEEGPASPEGFLYDQAVEDAKEQDQEDGEEDEESDSDDAPEEVGNKALMRMEEEESRRRLEEKEARRQAAMIRSKKIETLKIPGAVKKVTGKRTRDVVEEVSDNEGSSSASASASGSQSGSGSEDENEDEDEQGSFHTVSDEGEDNDQDDSDIESDDSEKLVEGPIDEETRRLRARMQAAMESAERRAKGAESDSEDDDDEEERQPKVKSAKSSTKSRSALKVKSPKILAPEAEEDAQWDMTPYITAKPLSAAAIAAAQNEPKTTPKAKSSEERIPKKQKSDRTKKKQKVVEVNKKIDDKTTLHLLPPTLITSGLPPIINPKIRLPGTNPRNTFMKNAMKLSGERPGKVMGSGRR